MTSIYVILGRLSRELSPTSAVANASAAVAAAAAAAVTQVQSPSHPSQSHMHATAHALSNQSSSQLQPNKLRSRSRSPPIKHIKPSPNHSYGQLTVSSRTPPPASPSRIEGRFDPDEDVDVEQCSDGEDGPIAGGTIKNSSNGLQHSSVSPGNQISTSNNEERPSGRESSSSTSNNPPKKKEKEKGRIMKAKCNCEELKYVDCFLETKELWDKFNELGTEMIITKTGR